jgi:hypothetical protein
VTPASVLAALAIAAGGMVIAAGLVPRIQAKAAWLLFVFVILWIALVLVL